MNKNLKVILVVVVLALLGAVIMFLRIPKASPAEPVPFSDKPQVKTQQRQRISGSFFDLMNVNKAISCSYSGSADGTDVSGATYVSGKNVRSDSVMNTSQTGKVESHMISDGTWIYTWTSIQPQGIKMKLEKDQNTMETPGAGSDSYKDLQQQFDFDCDSWTVDRSKFAVPTNITFIEFDPNNFKPEDFLPEN